MKRTNSSDNRSLLGQAIKIEQVPPRTCISNTVNPPHVYQRVPPQMNEFGNGIVGQSQLAPNPSVNQLLFTNPSLVSATRFGQAPLLNTISNAGNPPLMPQREQAQVIGFGTGNVGHSQWAPNPPANQLTSTNIGLISPALNTINKLRLTPQMFPSAIEAISRNDLEAAMKTVGVKNIEELAYLTDIKGSTLLSYAAELGRAKPIRILLSKVLDPQQLMQKKNNRGYTALLFAARFGHTKAITAMLKAAGNPQQLAEQIEDAQGINPLITAAYNGHENVITAILKSVSNPQQLAEQRDKDGHTALIHASFNGQIGVIAAIFSGVSNPQLLAEQQSNDGTTVLMLAIKSSASTLVITKILESVDDAEKLIFQVGYQGLNSFTYALTRGNLDAALLLFDKAKDKAALLLKKDSSAHSAGIELMQSDIIKVFLEKYNGLNQ